MSKGKEFHERGEIITKKPGKEAQAYLDEVAAHAAKMKPEGSAPAKPAKAKRARKSSSKKAAKPVSE